MSQAISLSLLLVLGLPNIGCGSSVEVLHRGTIPDWHEYRAYALGDHPINGGSLDPLLRTAVHDAMSARGYRRSEPASADLLVSYGIVLGPVAGRSHGDCDESRDDVDAPTRSKSLVLVVQEASSGRIVWLGVSAAAGTDRELRARALEAILHLSARVPRARSAEAGLGVGRRG